jgi:probable F420-dependent oxidoreductase
MRIGVVFPQTEFDGDALSIRDYAQAAEELGYSHILVYDHVLGANPDRPDKLIGPYTHEDPFLEPFVLFAYMASITRKIEFTTGILILPQRQTALVAKQAATLDLLSGGRLRLGVGIGWNHVEYQALGQDFHTRGRRIEEQIEVLRRLWKEPLVNFDGKWDQIPDAGLKPFPIQKPIPIWMGGHHDNVLRRLAEIGDGWMSNYRKAADAEPSISKIKRYLEQAGRDWSAIGIEARLWYGHKDRDKWNRYMEEWRKIGATHLTLNTMQSDLAGVDEHIAAMEHFAKAIDL